MTLAPTIEDPAYFDRLAEVEVRHWWALGMWRLASHWLDRELRGRRGLAALDVGCGTGGTMARLSDRPEIARVLGLDPSAAALRHARRKGLEIATADARRLPFRGKAFDLVVCCDVLQHLDDGEDATAVREIGRVLRPGGVAIVRANGRGWAGQDGPNRAPYRLCELTAVVAEAGLLVERATYANCLPALAQEVRGRVPIAGRREPPHPAGGGLRIRVPGGRLNRIMGGVSAFEAYAAGKMGMRLPFGHSTMLLARRCGE